MIFTFLTYVVRKIHSTSNGSHKSHHMVSLSQRKMSKASERRD